MFRRIARFLGCVANLLHALPHLGLDSRATASISANACSATEKAETPGVFVMVTPCLSAATRSMLSVPVPHIESKRR